MAKSSARESIKLTSVDDLFSTEESRAEQQREKVMNIPLSEISDFPNHPFKVQADAAMLEMADSVKQHGILIPGLVRPKAEGGYEMIAGHRRKKASELAGRETMPCIVREMDDDTAILAMVDSNLQRENILPSEKSLAYKMKLEAMKRQGQRVDLTSAQLGRKLKGKESREILAEEAGESRNQISRYIRLTNLVPSILEMEASLIDLESKESDIMNWVDMIKGFVQIEAIDRETVLSLIDCIEIHEKQIIDSEKVQKVTIRYKFVGQLKDALAA
jgi:ParB family chromosome partitioning protein